MLEGTLKNFYSCKAEKEKKERLRSVIFHLFDCNCNVIHVKHLKDKGP